MLVAIYFIVLLAILFCIMVGIPMIKEWANSNNETSAWIGVTFIVVAILLILLITVLPSIKPTCTLDGLL